ncbi:MAG: hypothetical protein MJ180_00320 [Candidatus Gastranaerophilales bacterium]|nr:hypothetical protein [Candidatus Gastranaerophilales bacterium]
MSIAPVNCDLLALTDEKGILEIDLMLTEAELQHLSIHAGHMYEEYTAMLSKSITESGVDNDPELGTDAELNTEQFQREFEVAQSRLQNQEKMLEMEKTRKQNKLTMINNLIESTQKRLEKNVEGESKGIGS